MMVGGVQRIRAEGERSYLDGCDPRGRVASALVMALAIAFVRSFEPLIIAWPLPLLLALTGDRRTLLRALAGINLAGLFVCILLPLSYPGNELLGVFSRDGLLLSALILCKLNLISVVTVKMIVPLDIGEIDNVLRHFGIPEKFRILLLLTTRQIFILTDRIVVMTRAVALRSARLKGITHLRVYANMLGTTLIHSSDRGERSLMAMRARGGFQGFHQYRALAWHWRDTLLTVILSVNAVAIILLGLYTQPL